MPPDNEKVEITQEKTENDSEEKDFRDFIGIEPDELSDPKWDNHRFRVIYAKHKSEQRSNDQLREDFKKAGEHIQKVTEAAERIARASEIAVTVNAQNKVGVIQDEVGQMQERMNNLKTERKQARTDFDWDKVDIIEDQMKKLEKTIERKANEAEKTARDTKVTPPRKELNPQEKVIQVFTQNTSWFNQLDNEYDPQMVLVARDYDNALMARPKYMNRPDLINERLDEVKKYTEKKFNWKKVDEHDEEKIPRRSQVEGVGTERISENRNEKLKLNADEKRIAHRMLDHLVGADKAESEYAKQLQMLGGR